MGFVLDAIIRKDLIGSRNTETTNYITINSSDVSDFVDISGAEDGYLISVTYVNGSSANIEFSLEGSLDNVSYAQIPNSAHTITDTDGSITWDVINSNANFVRITWTVTSGSLDIFGQISAKRRH